MKDDIKPIISEKNPKHIVLHIGTNDLNSSKTPTEIGVERVDLANSFKTNNNNISISSWRSKWKFEEDLWHSSLQFINHYPSIKPN